MEELLAALDQFGKGKIVFTMPNADADGRVIRNLVNDYVQRNPGKSVAFDSLGQKKYLSLMRQASVVVGNSSSGIIEAPSFGVPTINIGDRQKGRIVADSVIQAAPDKSAIVEALKKAVDPVMADYAKEIGADAIYNKINSM